MRALIRLSLVAALLTPISACLHAQPATPARPADAADANDSGTISVTNHSIRLDGRTLNYTAAAGFMPMKSETGEHQANIFNIAYTLDGVADPATRPVIFIFNGGPGSSSVWLHLGTAGPMRVEMGDDDGAAPLPPGRLIENEGTWLGVADLVFIDPVGTGYSRPVGDSKQSDFSGLDNDARSVAEFIRLWTTKNTRWTSPKFLSGESYGTTRAAAVTRRLQQQHNMYINGVILISSILDFQTARFDTGNDLPFVLFLPTYTATAWKHGRLGADLQRQPIERVLEESRRFAIDEYLPALARGDALTGADRDRVVERVARFTGLTKDYIERSNLRVEIGRFTKELLRDRRRTVGRLDSRFTGIDRDSAGERFEFDPSLAAISGVYTAALNDYVRRSLRFESDLPYEILTGRVQPWPYSPSTRQGYANLAEELRRAMTQNPHLKVHVANGYYDLATPFFATENTFARMALDPELSDNVTMSYYESGHMMYIHIPSLLKLRAEVEGFVRGAISD